MNPEPESTIYENRIVCFLDILGFGENVDATVDSAGAEVPGRTAKILEALLSIRNVLDVGQEHMSESKRVTQFSDSVVISFLVKEISEVFFTLVSIQWVMINLIQNGMVARGGIDYGKLYHTNEVLFGPGLVSAYRIESDIAEVPRIIVTPEVVEMGARYHAKHHDVETERKYLEGCLSRDEDGHYYIDYFLGASSELDEPVLDFPAHMDSLRRIIEPGLQHPLEKVRAKYEWMRVRFNVAAKHCRSAKFLDTLFDADVQDVYASMQDIPQEP